MNESPTETPTPAETPKPKPAAMRHLFRWTDGDGNEQESSLIFDSITIADSRRCRKELGRSPRSLHSELIGDMDADTLVQAAWLGMLQQGHDVDFAVMSRGMTRVSLVKWDFDFVKGDDDPQP